MSNRLGDAFFKAGIHAVTFVLIYWCIVWLASHSPARAVYGLISGWWAALYIGYVVSIGLLSGVIVAIGYVIVGITAVYSQWDWFYSGLPERLDVGFLVYPLVAAGIAFASPIVVNFAVRRLTRLIRCQQRDAHDRVST